MTKARAKRECLKIWRYLRDHPEIEHKQGLPYSLYEIIGNQENQCPLCELFLGGSLHLFRGCKRCPLNYRESCYQHSKWYLSVRGIEGNSMRKKAAARIVELVERW